MCDPHRTSGTTLLLGLPVVLFWGTAATAFELALRWVSPHQLLPWSVAVPVLGAPLLPATFAGLGLIVGSLLWRARAEGRRSPPRARRETPPADRLQPGKTRAALRRSFFRAC